MRQFFKQFMESGIRSFPNIFFTARVKLTLVYVLTTMLVIVFFSVGLFEVTSRNIRIGRPPRLPVTNVNQDQQILQYEPLPERPRRDPIVEQEIRRELIQDIKENIIIIDLILLCITTLVGYVLSGLTLRPIRESYDRQKKFIADASHDLRTPLAIMQSEIEVALLDKKGDHRDVLESNLEEVGHMNKLVENLFTLAKLDQDDKVTMEEIQIGELVTKVAHSYESLAQEKGITLETKATRGVVHGNAYQLERALRNIITNALTYTERGSVTISGEHNAKRYLISVRDTGVGIKKSDISHVFDRFYKGDNSRTNTASSGLGLSIAQEIIRAHKGEIKIESEEGKGTEVKIRL